MDIERLTLGLRARRPWEATDLGLRLALSRWWPLMLVLFAIFLPVVGVVSLLPLDWSWKSLIIWWLKPLFERPVLYVLSRVIFSEMPTIRTTLRSVPALLRPQWFASLTWRRLSVARSYDLPVLLLEGLGGVPRAQRLQVLHRTQASQSSWLTLIGVHLETALTAGFILLMVQLVPTEIAGFSTTGWMQSELLWFVFYVIAVGLVLPFYVAAGFSLYLNRRVQLEGWDIELAFRRIAGRQRWGGSIVAMAMAGLMLTASPEPSVAATQAVAPSAAASDSGQYLSADKSREDIQSILANDAVTKKRTIKIPRFLDEMDIEKPDNEPGPDWMSRLQWLARLIEGLGWVLLAAALVWLAFNYRRLLERLSLGWPGKSKPSVPAPETLFGLDVRARALPSDVPREARNLWQSREHRAAVSLLYRASLARLMSRHGSLRFRASDTEHDALATMKRELAKPITHYLADLTQTWCDLAYGHRLPADTHFDRLASDWTHWFEQDQGDQPFPGEQA